jgi:hypothetical protein
VENIMAENVFYEGAREVSTYIHLASAADALI